MRARNVLFSALLAAGCSSSQIGGASSGQDAIASARAQGGWRLLDAPAESVITGGPWTLEQVGANTAAPSAGYCVSGAQQRNPGAMRMQPYYHGYVVGRGAHLQGYFDYRPKDIDEAVVAAVSDDYGRTWTFQQQALEMTTTCPASDATNNGSDDGQGHPFVLTTSGVTRLYTLDRSAANVDSAGLVIHEIAQTIDSPLGDAPAAMDVPARTSGLFDPDGIVAVVPGIQPTTVIYLQKQLDGDTAFPAAQQCASSKANHDVTTLRLASTTDGVAFTDLGALHGINDSTDVSLDGTRYVGPRGSVLLFEDGHYGFFFSGGSCLDEDSDAFHYIGYAESTDLRNWTVVSGMNNPLISINAAQITDSTGATKTIPSSAALAGTQGWFGGRVYGPGATIIDDHRIAVSFSGYHTKKPKNALGDYRSIGRVLLQTRGRIVAGSGDGDEN
jgi:hypothetical protein